MSRVLLLTGTCGSGKSTIAEIVSREPGWARISEDDVWKALYGKDRGALGTPGHRAKRARVHAVVFEAIRAALASGRAVVLDATVHESPPEAFGEYAAFFEALAVPWELFVLHPRLEIATARDAGRSGWHAGPQAVASLRAKFTGAAFPPEAFLDTSSETPQETARRILG